LMRDTMAMCSAMSVARTSSIMILRICCCAPASMRHRKLQSRLRSTRKAADRWWLSLGDLSLESMACHTTHPCPAILSTSHLPGKRAGSAARRCPRMRRAGWASRRMGTGARRCRGEQAAGRRGLPSHLES
jgi:hypothetical protein